MNCGYNTINNLSTDGHMGLHLNLISIRFNCVANNIYHIHTKLINQNRINRRKQIKYFNK